MTGGIASGSYDRTLRIWPGPTVWPALLCAKLTTNTSHQRWRDWVSSTTSRPARTSRSPRT